MIKSIDNLESNLVGVAGEYLVAGELTLRGFLASITLRNSRGIDIIASSPNGEKSVSIQVKTNNDGQASWILNKKCEEFKSENHYYIFVALSPLNERPNFYVVPSSIVAKQISNDHQLWLQGKKKDGTSRKDSTMRKFSDKNALFLERWNDLPL